MRGQAALSQSRGGIEYANRTQRPEVPRRRDRAAGVSQTLWSMDDLYEKMDARCVKPGKRGLYKKHIG